MSAIEASLRLEIASFQQALAKSQGEVAKFKEKAAAETADLHKRLFEKTEQHKLQLAGAKKGLMEVREEFRRKGMELRKVLFDPIENQPVKMGSGRGGMAALTIAQFADDAQYGLRGIMNNIPGVVMAIGGSAGIAGALSIAAVAAKFLWDMFSGSDKAAEKTAASAERVKEVMSDLRGRLDDVADAQNRVFGAQLDKYVSSVQQATDAWGQQKQNIADALRQQQDLTKVLSEQNIARLRLQKTAALAQAPTQGGRAGIEATFDRRIAEEQAKALEKQNQLARESADLSLRSQAARKKEAEEAVQTMRLSDEAAAQRKQEIASSSIGRQSDQARNLNGLTVVENLMKLLDAEHASTLRQGARPRAGLQAEMSGAHARRLALLATRDADMANLRAGNLTFDAASKEAEANSDGTALKAYKDTLTELSQLDAQRTTYAAELLRGQKALNEAAYEQRNLEREKQLMLETQAASQAEMQAALAEIDARAAETLRKQAAAAAEMRAQLDLTRQVLVLETEIARERAAHEGLDTARSRHLADQLAILQLQARLQEQLKISATEANRMARDKVAAERAATNEKEAQKAADKSAPKGTALRDLQAEMEIERLRASGRQKSAAAKERELRTAQMADDFQRATGITPDRAMSLAQERMAYQDRTLPDGRHKIRGVSTARLDYGRHGLSGRASGDLYQSRPLSAHGPLTAGGGLAGYADLQRGRTGVLAGMLGANGVITAQSGTGPMRGMQERNAEKSSAGGDNMLSRMVGVLTDLLAATNRAYYGSSSP